MKGGVAEADGRLMPGDQFISINGEDVSTSSQEQVAEMLKVNGLMLLLMMMMMVIS